MISKEEFKEKASVLISDEEKKKFAAKKKNEKILKSVILSIEAAVIIVLCGVFYNDPAALISAAIVGIIIMLVTYIVIKSTTAYDWEGFKKAHANQLFKMLLNGYKFDYDQTKCVSKAEFDKSKFVTSYDHYYGEDLLKVNIKNDDNTDSNVVFKVCDLKLTEERTRQVTHRNPDGSTYTTTETYEVTVYNGMFAHVNFPFEFKCILAANTPSKYESVSMEDIDFNKKFDIHTSDQVEAYCILTPTMITKLKQLSKRLGKMKILIEGNDLYLGATRNMFELNFKSKTLDENVFDGFYDDVSCVFNVLEEIKSNNKVFKM